MDIQFCQYWSRQKRETSTPITREAARAAHDSGRWYTVLIGRGHRLECFLEISVRTIGVHYVDELRREVISLTFREVDRDRTSPALGICRRFGPDDRVIACVSHIYGPGGSFAVRRERYHPLHVEFEQSQLDILDHRTLKPAFCRYDALLETASLLSTPLTHSLGQNHRLDRRSHNCSLFETA